MVLQGQREQRYPSVLGVGVRFQVEFLIQVEFRVLVFMYKEVLLSVESAGAFGLGFQHLAFYLPLAFDLPLCA